MRPGAPTGPDGPVKSWWAHTGAFAVVMTGLGTGELVLPVRVPQRPGQQGFVEHFLADPQVWHKIDVVRHQDPNAAGGWGYEAHLLVLKPGYQSPATVMRRNTVAGIERRGGIDVNVSNITVVSVNADLTNGADVRMSRVAADAGELARINQRRTVERRRQRQLDRSRRANNAAQYTKSKRQQARDARRAERDLRPITVELPKGPRVANKAGNPKSAYRHDICTTTYKTTRADMVADGEARTRTKQLYARRIAAQLVAAHGANLIVEDGDLTVWARRWGRAMSENAPGMLVTAIRREAQAVLDLTAPGCTTPDPTTRPAAVPSAATRPTAMSQHCPCGTRVTKTLADRTHTCPTCTLTADRDVISALLGAHVTFTDHRDPGTARVDYHQLGRLIETTGIQGLQAALFESTTHRPNGRTVEADGISRRAARRNGATAPKTTPDETATHTAPRTTRERLRTTGGLHRNSKHELRDSA